MAGRRRKTRPRGTGRLLLLTILVVATVVAGSAAYVVFSPPPTVDPHTLPMAMHTHSSIMMETWDGAKYVRLLVPSSVGQPGSPTWKDKYLAEYGVEGVSPIHMHAADAYEQATGWRSIHVESNTVRDFVLGDFFRVWGGSINSTCLTLPSPVVSADGFNVPMPLCQTVNSDGSVGRFLELHVGSDPAFLLENKEFENLVLRNRTYIRIRFSDSAIPHSD